MIYGQTTRVSESPDMRVFETTFADVDELQKEDGYSRSQYSAPKPLTPILPKGEGDWSLLTQSVVYRGAGGDRIYWTWVRPWLSWERENHETLLRGQKERDVAEAERLKNYPLWQKMPLEEKSCLLGFLFLMRGLEWHRSERERAAWAAHMTCHSNVRW
jgi:hypothetical protein